MSINNFSSYLKFNLKSSINGIVESKYNYQISSMKVIQARFDLNQTILAVKENIEVRYGSLVQYMRLQLKDAKMNLLADMDQDIMPLSHYGTQTGMIIFVIDLNPNSIHKQIQSFEGVEKYVISEEDYDKLPENFRKWKKKLLEKNPHLINGNKSGLPTQSTDPNYLSQLASTIQVGSRCRLESGSRGEVKFVGKVMDLGQGYFVGVKLDQPYGNGTGTINGVQYFEADDKYGIFIRPNALQVGDFPQLDIDDQI